MSRKSAAVQRRSLLAAFRQSVRERVEEIFESYDHLRPDWCRSVAVELDDVTCGLGGAGPVTAECVSSRGEMAFTLPSDWLDLTPRDQELSVVFWLALDDLSRGLTSTVGPIVDAVRRADRSQGTASEPAADLYKTVLPLIGSSALDLAQEAVARGRRCKA